MTLDAFLETAWTDHGDHAAAVGERLSSSTSLVASAADVAPWTRLVVHVFGEHLGEWARGWALLRSLDTTLAGTLDAAAPDAREARSALERGLAALAFGGGDVHALDALSRADRAAVLATLAAAFVARGESHRAVEALDDALGYAAGGLADGSPAIRALAIAGNNVASTLETKSGRDAFETRGMLVAAQAGLDYWTRAGGWLERERALYLLARARLAAGDAGGAIRAARDCIAVCEANDAPAFERFFAQAVLALALQADGDVAGSSYARAVALAAYEQVPGDERDWCERERGELAAFA
jgi:hypothetical protein